MKVIRRGLIPVLAVAAGVTLAASGAAWAAGAPGTAAPSRLSPAPSPLTAAHHRPPTAVLVQDQGLARAAAGGPLGNYRITGVERAIACLTAHRCVAVGRGGGTAPGQVVTVVGGKQTGVSVVRSASDLFAVSCPNRFGCWAIGRPRAGGRKFVLVKISGAGSVTSVTMVGVAAGTTLSSISCTAMTTCEIFGTNLPGIYINEYFLAALTGQKLLEPSLAGDNIYANPGGISCFHVACVAVGWWVSGSNVGSSGDAILTTKYGLLEEVATVGGPGLASVSCASSSICYATGLNRSVVITLDDGAQGNRHSLPIQSPSSIECAGTTCWAAGLSDSNPNVDAFVMITKGVPAGSPITDTAINAAPPAITRRGNGFAAIGPATNGGPKNVSEVVTN